MTAVRSFAPVADASARVLILGSMPGTRSLDAGQYYAHPRNAFWPIMASLLGFEATAPYPQRLDALRHAGIALWDVLQSCVRPGSLDAAIEPGSRVVHDFVAFFAAHPLIRQVCFNGVEAETSYRRYVLPQLSDDGLRYARLPSTSPAHAGLGFDQKRAIWRAALALDGRLG